MSLVSELKRRNVIRMAGLYLVGAWLLTQVAATLLPVFEAPAWVMKAVVGVLAVGFVPAIVFAWVFELTPDGLKRDAEVPAEHSIGAITARRMEHSIVVLLLLAVAFFCFDKFYLAPKREAALVVATTPTVKAESAASKSTITDKSIAVLPFVDMSQARDQEWFGDGLAEEILNALAKTPDLQVSARTSSFRYKGSTLAVPQIAKELGVAHVLEGSIRSTPERIRVTAQLIRASDGFHLWSQTYDRDPADIIAIQEDLARSIATVMQTSMDPKALADMARVGTRSVEAYQAYIRGLASRGEDGRAGQRQAYELFEQARTLDPGFAAANAHAARYWLVQLDVTSTDFGDSNLPRTQMEANFNERIKLAIAAAVTSAERAGYQAIAASQEMRWREAIRLYQAFLKERPIDADARSELTSLALVTNDQALLEEQLAVGWPQAQQQREYSHRYVSNEARSPAYARAAAHALILLERWPDHSQLLYQSHRALLYDKRVQAAADVLDRLKRIAPADWTDNVMLAGARQACAEGRRTEVEQQLADPKLDVSWRWHLLELLGESAAATSLLMKFEREGRTRTLSDFLVYPNFDARPFPSLMRILEREKVNRPPPVPLPFACPPAAKGVG